MDLGVYPAEVVKFMREQAVGEIAWIRRLKRVRAKDASR
jgi:hypothetical protein